MTTTTTVPTVLELALADIAEHPDNPRQDVGDVADLAKSIAEHGVLEPVIVAPWPEDLKGTPAQKRKHLLIAGHRRVAAARRAKQRAVPALLREDLDTRTKQLETMLVENLHRADLSPVEEGVAYQGLLDLGLTQTALAKEVGQPTTRIRERLKIAKLPETVRGRVHTGAITIADAIAVGEFADDEKITKALLADAGTSNFRASLERVRVERKESAARAKQIAELTAAGVRIRKTKTAEWVAVGSLFDGVPSKYDDDDKLHRWFLDHHAACPGALVVDGKIESWERPQLHYGCDQPDLHPKPVKPKSKAELAAEQKAADAAATLKANLEASTNTRRAWLREECLQQATPGLATDLLLAHIFDDNSPSDDSLVARTIRWALGLPDKTPVTDARAAAQKLSLPALVVLMHIVEHAYDEETLDSEQPWGLHHARSWARMVGTTYGYQWTDFELERFAGLLRADEPTIEDHELPAGDDGEGEDGDDVDEQPEVDQ